MENTKYNFLKDIFGNNLGSILIKFAQNDQRMAIFAVLIVFLLIVLLVFAVSVIVSLGSLF